MAKTNRGWIMLYRDIQQSAIWMTNEPFDVRSAWIDMIMMANHEDKEIILRSGRKVIKRGQFHTSIYKLADRWHWSRNRVRHFLGTLNECTMAHTERTTGGTTVTIVNYNKFQVGGTTGRTTNETTKGTTEGTTDGPRTRMKEECKKNEEKKKSVPLTNAFGYEVEE